MENKYCEKHRGVLVNNPYSVPSNNGVTSATGSGSGQSSFDRYDLWSDDEEYWTSFNVAEITLGQVDRTAVLLTATRLYSNSPPEAPKDWGQINPNLNDYHFKPMVTGSWFWIPDLTNWWGHQEVTKSKYTNLCNVARDIVTITPHSVGAEANLSLRWDVIGWGQSKTYGGTLRENVVVWQCALANRRILEGNDPALDTTNTENDSEMKTEVEERSLHRMANVHNFWEMSQGRQNLHATQKYSRAQNQQMTAIAYISDMEEIVEASWSHFQHDGAAAYELSERSPLPPAQSWKDVPWAQTQIFNVRQIRRINHYPVEIDAHSAPHNISDTEN